MMTKGNIGLNSGKIWVLLEDNACISYDTLKKETKLSDAELWTAIGWLSWEDKVIIDNSHSSPVFCPGKTQE